MKFSDAQLHEFDEISFRNMVEFYKAKLIKYHNGNINIFSYSEKRGLLKGGVLKSVKRHILLSEKTRDVLQLSPNHGKLKVNKINMNKSDLNQEFLIDVKGYLSKGTFYYRIYVPKKLANGLDLKNGDILHLEIIKVIH